MATVNSTNPTLMDVLKRMDPKGAISSMVEPLKWKTPLLEDMTWMEGNLPSGHTFSSRTALPSLTWRQYNQGVAPSKSTNNNVTESMGMLAGQSKIDVQLAKLNGNEAAFRASEDAGFIQAYSRTIETALFYSSTKDTPNQVMGLSPRLDATSGNPAASQIVKSTMSSSGADQNSVWLIVWSPETVFGIYPKGSVAGLEMKDMGEQLTVDGGGTNQFRAYVTDFTWKMGLVVKDSRYVARLCNVDTSASVLTGSQLIQDLTALTNAVQDLDSGRPVLYMNRKLLTFLQGQSVDSTKNSTLTYDNVGGKPVMQFMGIPIRRTDALLSTEAIVA
jgi:hypothetical protein